MRRIFLGIVLLAIVGSVAYWRSHRNRPPREVAYAGDRKVTVWSSNAQVREPLQNVSFGDRLEVLRRVGDSAEIRTPAGLLGWVATRDLLPEELWLRAVELTKEARAMPPQARAHTKVLSNLRLEPGRDATRLFQLGRDIPVEILERRVIDVSSPAPPPAASADGDSSAADAAAAKKEDWLLVLAQTKDSGEFAGWVVGRFLDLDLPQPLPDYASSAGMRVVGWQELNRVEDKTSGARKPQYLVFGTRNPEGDPCDFTTMRIFTWGSKRQRYETAFVESDFCGHMPVQVTPATATGGDASFRFEATMDDGDHEEREYRLHQTIVRRTDEGRRTRRPTGRRP